MSEETDSHPPLESGWMTGNMLRTKFAGSNAVWDRRIRALGEKLIKDVMASTGMGEHEARLVVEENLVGMREHAHNDAFAASPEALRLLHEEPRPKRGRKCKAQEREQTTGGRGL